MKLKLLLLFFAALSIWLLYLDRRWILGRLRLHSAPVVLLILALVLGISWLLGVMLTRVLNLASGEPFYVLGVGLVATAAAAATIALVRTARRWMAGSSG